jgi:DNA (cytosine-5)-methyltransferase 3A
MNILSLFDGISCGQVALERVGIKVDNYYASEIDKYAIQVTQKNYPNTIQLGDVTKWKEWNIDWKSIDLLIGGSPCQSFSVAGKQEGFDGKSGLFYDYVDIYNQILKYNPNIIFLLENVVMKKEWKDVITNTIGVQPIMINSALVSAQQRKRLYWTNIPNIEQPNDKNILLKDILESGILDKDKSYALTAFYNGTVIWNTLERKQRTMIFEPIRLGHLNKGGQGDRIYSVKGKSICLSANGGGRGAKTGLYKIDLPEGDYTVRKLTPIECERLQTLPDNYTEGISNTQRYKAIGNGWTVDVIAHIFKHIKTI